MFLKSSYERDPKYCICANIFGHGVFFFFWDKMYFGYYEAFEEIPVFSPKKKKEIPVLNWKQRPKSKRQTRDLFTMSEFWYKLSSLLVECNFCSQARLDRWTNIRRYVRDPHWVIL